MGLHDLTATLSIYAKMFREAYRPLFDDAAVSVISRATDPRIAWSEPYRWDFFCQGPFVLMAYAQSGCGHAELFGTCLCIMEQTIDELTYEHLCIVAYALALV